MERARVSSGPDHFLEAPAGLALTIPPALFMVYQMMFAIITPALITGAIADRMRFSAWAWFLGIWAILVYSPVAHWVFAPSGWLFKLGALDFAGGTVVHVNAGIAALALAVILGRRRGWPNHPMRAHSLPLTLLGTGILWFGWFGFNAGSALAANGLAVQAFINTNLAAAAAMLGWLVAERIKTGHATTLGAASGAVAGLVAITPCAGFVGGMAPVYIGLIAGVICYLAVSLKFRFGYDDALDVVGVHLVGGLVGCLAIGVFATTGVNAAGAFELLWGSLLAVGPRELTVLSVLAAAVLASAHHGAVHGPFHGDIQDIGVGNRILLPGHQEHIPFTQKSLPYPDVLVMSGRIGIYEPVDDSCLLVRTGDIEIFRAAPKGKQEE